MASLQRLVLFALAFAAYVMLATSSPTVVSVSKDKSPDAQASFRHHYKRVRSRMPCAEPQRRIVRMQDVLPDPAKKYVPDCTILYECAHDTGCCDSGKKCGPKTSEEVQLHFHVFDGVQHSTEVVTFLNHTTCACEPINELPR